MAKPCKQPPIHQISTEGDCSRPVNRDLETLFATLNQVLVCVSKMSDALDAQTGGNFAGGAGSPGAGGGGPDGGTLGGGPLGQGQGFMMLDSGGDLTLPDQFSGTVIINASADLIVTLPVPAHDSVIVLVHGAASKTITVKDDLGNTICTLKTGRLTVIRAYTSGATPSWPTAVITFDATGDVFFPTGFGPVVHDTADGNDYRLKTTAGVPGGSAV